MANKKFNQTTSITDITKSNFLKIKNTSLSRNFKSGTGRSIPNMSASATNSCEKNEILGY